MRRTGRSGMRIGEIVIDVTPLREGRDFRLLFTGRFVSMAGNAVATTAASWQVYALTGSSLAVGMLTLASRAGWFGGLRADGRPAGRADPPRRSRCGRPPRVPAAPLPTCNGRLARPAPC